MNRRLAYIVLAVLAVGLVGGTVLTLRSGGGADGPPPAGRLGPTPGPDSEGHISAKRAYLEALAQRSPNAPAAALVSFTRFMTASDVGSLVAGMRASAVFVRFPAAGPEALQVTRSLEAAVTARASELADITRAEIEALEGRGGDPGLLEQRREAFAQTVPGCECVYAVAVEGVTVERLQAMLDADGVRLVDVPDPLTDDLGGWELSPLLPSGPVA